MRKFTGLILLLGCVYANARQISPSEAMTLATDFMNSAKLRTAGSKALKPMKAPGENADTQSSPYYVFNRGEAEGFVIISGDDRAPKILGYSDKGSFDAENLPPQLKVALSDFANQIESLPENLEANKSWKNATYTRSGIDKLYSTADWGQGAPFNDLCPEVNGVKAPVGCVATAMAITMQHYNWPDCTRGGEQVDFYHPELKFDYNDYKIDWNALSDSNNPNFAAEAAKLSLSASIAAQMIYGEFESNAEVWPVGHKLIEHYAYAKGVDFLERRFFSDEEWNAMLQEQLAEVGPVIYSGHGSAGHCFVIDGCDASGLYHVNWGWDGYLNGYYSLDFSDIGGMSFGEWQGMVINIRPDYEKKEYSKSFIPSAEVYFAGLGIGGWNFMSPNVIPGEKTVFKMPFLTFNCHVGFYRFAVVDDYDNIIQLIDDEYFFRNTDCGTYCGFPGTDLRYELILPELKDGQRYQLVSLEAPEEIVNNFDWLEGYPSNDPKDYRLVLGGMMNPSYFYATGNRSDVVDVNFHVDEDLPAVFNNQNIKTKEFTDRCLKGSSTADNIVGPVDKIKFEVVCTDKDGNPEEPWTNCGPDPYYYCYNVSVYSDKIDVYIKRDTSKGSRNDEGIDLSLITENDGLIFKKTNEGLSLIGYDNVAENVTVPKSLVVAGVEMPVISIEKNALVFAPITSLTIEGENIRMLENCALGGLNDLKSMTIRGMGEFIKESPYSIPFLQTSPENVYFADTPTSSIINEMISVQRVGTTPTLFVNDIENFYIGSLPDSDSWLYLDPWYYLKSLRNGEGYESVKSYNVPGLGSTDRIGSLEDENLPMTEMWSYAVDRDHNSIMIKPQIEEIKILSVLVNGQTVESDGNGIYAVPSTEEMTVTVNYILHDRQEMTTVYDANYNNELRSQNLSVDIPVESIQISKTEAELKVGESLTLTATVLPEDASDKTVIWASDNEAVATVDAEGNVTAISLGSATITASCGEVSASSVVTVVPTPAESITLSQTDAQLKVGETLTLTAIVLPENATDETVTWTSDNEAIATVDAEGNVTAVSVGNATIIASCGEISASCIVMVNPILVESIQLSPDNWNGEEGESFMIEVVVLPEEATDKSLTWSSSDESIATVDAEGNVSVLKEGNCVIRATSVDGSGIVAECVITSAAGLEGLFSDSDRFDIYDFKGFQLKKDADREALKTLTPGIYIVRRGGEMKKVVIR